MNKKDFYSLMQKVPKAELHLHAEAVLSKKTIQTLYKKKFNKKMPYCDYKKLFAYKNLKGFLDSFLEIQSFFTNEEDLNLLFLDFKEYLQKNNIVYAETFFSPTSHLKKGFNFHSMIEVISNALDKIQEETGRTVNLIVDVSRSFGTENAMNNLNLVINEKNKHIIGIGLGGDEEKGPAKDFTEVFKKAQDNNLHTVAHAGENSSYQSVKDSILLLNAERIGHGITSIQDKETLNLLKEKNIPLEICPTSNIYTKKYVHRIKDHPVKQLYQNGIPITLNTDDPTFFKISLIDEYWNLHNTLNFSMDEIKEIIKNSFTYSFMEENKKKEYIEIVEKLMS